MEIIDTSSKIKCHKCSGLGFHKDRGVAEDCAVCNGTGLWTEESYIIVATTPEGQRIAFQSEFMGK